MKRRWTQEDLWALVLRWRREALNLQHRQPRLGLGRVSGEERARCADELEAILWGEGTSSTADEATGPPMQTGEGSALPPPPRGGDA